MNRPIADPGHLRLEEQFAAHVRATPDAPALICDGRDISYAALDDRSSALAGRLRASGAVRGARVALLLEKSIDLYVAILATLKAGAAYVPLDVSVPPRRVREMLERLGPVALVATPRTATFAAEMTPVIYASAGEGDGEAPSPAVDAPRLEGGTNDLAYVMFTSGSTGGPKAVGVPHVAVTRLVHDNGFATFGPSDRFLTVSNVAFDAATLEIWGALANGGSLVVVPDSVVTDPELLCDVICEQEITAGFFTVVLFERMLAAAPAALEGVTSLIVGGEAVPPALFARASRELPPAQLLNGYGPTENTTFSCCFRLEDVHDAGRSVPIGSAIGRSTAWIMDEALELVDAGKAGEIVVGGEGLAWGYLNDPRLTAERFVPDHVGDVAGRRLYRTGDVGRADSTGVIEFVGRDDDQVKVRGFRVQLAEVEQALGRLPGVRTAAATTIPASGTRRLLGYVEVDEGAMAPRDMRTLLESMVPSFMVPSRLLRVDAMPLNANGKVDRGALAAQAAAEHRREPDPVTPPRALIDRVAAAWRRVLVVADVGYDENFFDLGGDSILLAVLREELSGLGCGNVSMGDLMEHTTIRSLVRMLKSADPGDGGNRQPRPGIRPRDARPLKEPM